METWRLTYLFLSLFLALNQRTKKIETMRTLFLALVFALPLLSFTSSTEGGPSATLAGHTSGEIDKHSIFVSPEITADGMEITSFSFTIVADERTVIQKTGSEGKLTDEMLKLIRMAESGQKLYFEKIVAKNKSGDEFKLQNLILVLK
jgi:hypothetical protein